MTHLLYRLCALVHYISLPTSLLSLSLSLYISLDLSLSFSPSLTPPLFISISLSVYLSLCLSLSVYVFRNLYTCFLCPPLCLPLFASQYIWYTSLSQYIYHSMLVVSLFICMSHSVYVYVFRNLIRVFFVHHFGYLYLPHCVFGIRPYLTIHHSLSVVSFFGCIASLFICLSL